MLGKNELPGYPLDVVQEVGRLDNGNTLIANWVAGNVKPDNWPSTIQIIEVTPAKKVAWAPPAVEGPRSRASLFDPTAGSIRGLGEWRPAAVSAEILEPLRNQASNCPIRNHAGAASSASSRLGGDSEGVTGSVISGAKSNICLHEYRLAGLRPITGNSSSLIRRELFPVLFRIFRVRCRL